MFIDFWLFFILFNSDFNNNVVNVEIFICLIKMDFILGNIDIGNIYENFFLINIGLELGYIGGYYL